jgi:hypothetical protein
VSENFSHNSPLAETGREAVDWTHEARPCVVSSEPSGSIKEWQFLEQLLPSQEEISLRGVN